MPAPSTDFAANRQLTQLSSALAAVERMAGNPATDRASGPIGAAYADASPAARRRFDRRLQHMAAWAASGLEALIAGAQAGRPVAPAAARLAEELRRAINETVRTLGS